jgi:transcriptional antiterminator RfaH
MSIEKQPSDPQWFAVYTRSRMEKKAVAEMNKMAITCFLPLHKVLRQWSDRKKWVEVPLFNSYVFVYITDKEYNAVLQVMGVVRFITFEGKAVAIPMPQIEAIRTYIEQGAPDYVAPEISLEAGANVEITRGAMAGLSGVLLNIQGKHRVKVEIDCVGKSLIIDIPRSSLKLL